MTEIRTARLIGRPPTPHDIDRYDELLNDPAVARTMGGLRSPDQLQEFMDRHLEKWQRYGFGPYLLFDADDGAYVGRGGLNRVSVLGVEETEVGYALLPRYWGLGLATEIARFSLLRAFTDLRLPSVVGFTLVENAASRHVMEKCGMVFEREFVYYDLPHVFLRVRNPINE